MSTPTANTVTTTETTSEMSGLTIGLIVGGGVILVLLLIIFGVYMVKRRQNAGLPPPSTSANLGSNRVPITNTPLNSGRPPNNMYQR